MSEDDYFELTGVRPNSLGLFDSGGNLIRNGLSNSEDYVAGTAANDLYAGNGGDDVISGASGRDFLLGNAGNDTLAGGSGSDTLYGGQGDDFIGGGAGADLLSGDLGSDILNGGGGNDIFYFDAKRLSGSDQINDFTRGTGNSDSIVIDNLTVAQRDDVTFEDIGANVLMYINDVERAEFFGTTVGAIVNNLEWL